MPWRKAGPGWSVVEYSAANFSGPVKGRNAFYLVSPAGRKYRFYATGPTAYPNLDLIDWSGDRSRILVQQIGTGDTRRWHFEQISLATGAAAHDILARHWRRLERQRDQLAVRIRDTERFLKEGLTMPAVQSGCRLVQIKIAVDDVDAAVAFYTKAFDFRYDVAQRTP